jgi:hypothetical protein
MPIKCYLDARGEGAVRVDAKMETGAKGYWILPGPSEEISALDVMVLAKKIRTKKINAK